MRAGVRFRLGQHVGGLLLASTLSLSYSWQAGSRVAYLPAQLNGIAFVFFGVEVLKSSIYAASMSLGIRCGSDGIR